MLREAVLPVMSAPFTRGVQPAGFALSRPSWPRGEIASLSGAGDDPRYFQISVPVQPGNSGGALVDERGNVIGIVSAKVLAHGHQCGGTLAASGALPENVNYAVKSREGRHVAVPNLGTPTRRPSQSWNRCQPFRPGSKRRLRLTGSLRMWSNLLKMPPSLFWIIDFIAAKRHKRRKRFSPLRIFAAIQRRCWFIEVVGTRCRASG